MPGASEPLQDRKLQTLTLRQAFPVWLRIGLLSFGGPAGQIALMHRELVEKRRWISEDRFLHALNFCTLLPGPEAQQLATYIGWLLHRTAGGLTAGSLFVLPGALLMLGLSVVYARFHQVPAIDAVFFGIKAAVLAVVVEAVVRIGKRALKTRAAVVIAAGAFVALFAFGAPFPLVIAASALAGALGMPVRVPVVPGAKVEPATSLVDQLFADGKLGHTLPDARRAAITALGWLALWAAPVLALWLWRGSSDVLTQEGVFFSKAAVVTFGGAYAVLAWIAQEVVVTFGWLSPAQMLDGLGLAETTPGPLILVLQFTGFVAAYQHAQGLSPLLAGTLGAGITLWVTFVPCFTWIFVLAPWVESVRGNLRLAAALAAITAAVVGVILNLSVFFAIHVLFAKVGSVQLGPLTLPSPEWSSIDLRAAAVSAIAFTMLLVLKQSLGRTLVSCAVLGALLKAFS
jgi:chromate transporter